MIWGRALAAGALSLRFGGRGGGGAQAAGLGASGVGLGSGRVRVCGGSGRDVVEFRRIFGEMQDSFRASFV